MRTIAMIATCLLTIFFTLPVQAEDYLPENIILMIGDGMGIAHITAARISTGKLNLDRFKVLGLLSTHSNNELITDSAAAATALATGQKTNNGMISMTPRKKPLKTVLEYAEDRGKATGLIATTTITHATPAAFASHIKSRKIQNEIAEQIAASEIEVLFGGGWSFFVPESQPKSKRKDDKNLLSALSARMQLATSREAFRKLDITRPAAYLPKPGALPEAKRRKVSLAEMTITGLDILSRSTNGFFLMVEGSQIDWRAHGNDSDGIVDEVTSFDKAVGVAYRFARAKGNTLLIVTADHETGGFAVAEGSIKKKVSKGAFTSNGHTGEMVPLFAYGPGSQAFAGIHDNTHIGRTLIKYVTAQ
jgi:alkaline phosphatase